MDDDADTLMQPASSETMRGQCGPDAKGLSSEGTWPFVSVIIPTFRDWARLDVCLAALRNQTYPQGSFEVVVVNNEPSDQCPLRELAGNVVMTEQATTGSYAARNQGLSIARGEIVAFTDADCVPTSDWISNAVKRLRGGEERIAGRVELFYRSEKLSAAEIHEREFAFAQQEFALHGTSATANMVTWKKHFDKVGPFNPALLSGGDMDWGWRAKDKGIPIVFAADVVVKHPARHRIRQLLAKRRRVVALSLREMPRQPSRIPVLLLELRPPLRYFWGVAKRHDLKLSERAALSAVHYLMRLSDAYHKILHCLGLYKPTRS